MAAAKFNTALKNKIFKNEGFREDMYLDQGGLPTIGYGFTKYSLTGKNGIPSWKKYWNSDGTPTGVKMTQAEADSITEKVTQEYIDQVNKDITNENLTEGQYNSIIDLYYRNGRGNVKRSGVLELINDGKIDEAADLIEKGGENGRLARVGGKVVEEGDSSYDGIINRNKRASEGLRSGVGASINPEDVTVIGEVQVGGGRVISNMQQVGEGEEVVESIAPEDNKNKNIGDFEKYIQSAYGDGYEVRQKDGRMVVVKMPVAAGESEPDPNYTEEVEEIDFNTYRNNGNSLVQQRTPPQVLGPEGEVMDQPTEEEGNQALELERQRQREQESAEEDAKAIERAKDAKRYQELKRDRKAYIDGMREATELSGQNPENFETVIEIDKELAEIEEEYGLTQTSDEEYERRRAEIVSDMLLPDDTVDDRTIAQDEPLPEIGEEEEGVADIEARSLENILVPSENIPNDANVHQGIATWTDENGEVQSSIVDDIVDDSATDETVVTTTDGTGLTTQNTNQPVGFMQGLGDLGNVIGQGLGLVRQIQDSIQGPDDLIMAALGQQAFAESLKDMMPKNLPGLSNQFKEHLAQTKKLAQQGFSVEEAQKAKKDIDSAYQKGLENSIRGTGGDRAKFLAMSGVLDEARSTALLEFASKDAELNRANQEAYTGALSFAEEFELNKSSTEMNANLQLELKRKEGAANFAKEAFASIGNRVTPEQRRYENMLRNTLSGSPYSYQDLTTPGVVQGEE